METHVASTKQSSKKCLKYSFSKWPKIFYLRPKANVIVHTKNKHSNIILRHIFSRVSLNAITVQINSCNFCNWNSTPSFVLKFDKGLVRHRVIWSNYNYEFDLCMHRNFQKNKCGKNVQSIYIIHRKLRIFGQLLIKSQIIKLAVKYDWPISETQKY